MTITATAYPIPADKPGHKPLVRLDVTATSPTPNNAKVSVYRHHPDGRTMRVLLDSNARLTAGSWTGFDLHAPLNLPVTYSVVCGTDEGDVGAVRWEATEPNLFPVDATTGGPARMYGWTGGEMLTPGVLTVAPGQSISVAGLPAESGVSYSLGVTLGQEATTEVYFLSGPYDLGEPVTVTTTEADRATLTMETPATGTSATVVITNDGVAPMTVQQPTWFEGTDYPVETDPVSVAADDRSVLLLDDRHWLMSPTNSDLSCTVTAIYSLEAKTRDADSAMQWAYGAKYPTVLTNGQRHAPAGSVVLVVSSEAELQAVRALLDDGGIILFNLVGTGWRDLRYAWVLPGQEQVSNPYGTPRTDRMLISLPYQETDVPAGYTIALWSLQDIDDTFDTLDDVEAAYASLSDAAIDARAS